MILASPQYEYFSLDFDPFARSCKAVMMNKMGYLPIMGLKSRQQSTLQFLICLIVSLPFGLSYKPITKDL